MAKAAAIFLLFLSQASSTDYVIDLVRDNRDRLRVEQQLAQIPENERVRAKPRPPVTHVGRPVPSYEITDLTFDKASYALAENFIYEVTIRYTGNTPEPFPVSPDGSLFRKSHAGLRAVELSLEYDDDVLRHQRTNLQVLYGSHNVADTLVMLKKNETVKVRIPAKWVLQSVPASAPFTWARSITPYAQLDLHFTDENFLPVKSAASVAIDLRR